MYHVILFVISSMLPTAKPEVITTPLTVDHEFVVLACDGTYVCMCVCVLLVCVRVRVCVCAHARARMCACTHVSCAWVHTCALCMHAHLSVREGQHC